MRYHEKPAILDYVMRYHKPSPQTVLKHYGVKGMKWGVRRTPEELGHKSKGKVEKAKKPGIIKTTVSGHGSIPKRSMPNSIIDHVSHGGKVDVRTFYGSDGLKIREIHVTDHGNSKRHSFGVNGEHAHDYAWNSDGGRMSITQRELTIDERKENEDIL